MNRSPMGRPTRPMPKMSAKKLRTLGGFASSTFDKPQTPAGGGNGPTPARGLKASRPTGPDRNTVDAVLERDQHSCAWCGGSLFGVRGRDWSIQHRRPRRAGGDPRPDTNLPSNLVALHGDGTTLCHGLIERERTVAYAAGFLLHAEASPSAHQIKHAVHGWVRLTDDGHVRPVDDNAEA